MWQAIQYYGILALEAGLGVFGLRLYEQPHYETLERLSERVEVRRYDQRLAAEVRVAASGDRGRNEAFQLLFSYIAGANQDIGPASRVARTAPVEVLSRRIAMTTPVQVAETADVTQMRFFLPSRFTIATVPQPSDTRVHLVEAPAETVAALRFSGRGRDFSDRCAELLDSLQRSRWVPVGEPYAQNDDAPFTIPVLRRNEAVVAVRSSNEQ